MIAICLVLSSLIAIDFAQMSPSSGLPARAAYDSHDPILITGDADFSDLGNPASYGVTGGSGIDTDPYIISGWEISATSAHGT